LHDVQRGMFIANRKLRLLIGAPFDINEELRKFVVAAQANGSFGGRNTSKFQIMFEVIDEIWL
jgi:hypothetical protein